MSPATAASGLIGLVVGVVSLRLHVLIPARSHFDGEATH
jgi:hypothetical protein